MIGTLDRSVQKATVIGGGIAGLLAAFRLERAGYEVVLYEASDRLGGLVRTIRTPYGIAEAAMHSTLVSPPVRELFHELEVELLPVRKDARARFIWRKGKLRRMPLGLRELAQAFLRAYFVLPTRGMDPQSLTLEEWAKRHLGQAALDYGLTPFVRGIYASRPSEIGVAAAFPALLPKPGHSLLSQILRSSRQRTGPRPPKKLMMTARDGMDSFTQALESRLRKSGRVKIHIGAPISQLPDTPNLIIATPADVAAKLIVSSDPVLATAIAGIEYAPLISITAFVRKSARDSKGVGVLVPEVERDRRCLGILFNSSSFDGRTADNDKHSSYTVMIGGTSQRDLVGLGDAELSEIVCEELRAMLGVDSPVHLEINRWLRAIPVYSPSLPRIWTQAGQGWCARPGRILFGNWTGQVSLRGMIESSLCIIKPV